MPIFDDEHRAYLRTLRFYTPPAVLALACFIEFIIFFDRGVGAGALGAIRTSEEIAGEGESVLSETKSGLLTSCFIFSFSIFSPVFSGLGGMLTTRAILLTGLVIWIIAVLACALAPSYGVLLAGRSLTGAGEAAFTGFFLPMIDNIAPRDKRTVWIGLFWCQVAVGTSVGMAIGGIVGPDDVLGGKVAGWRMLFFLEVVVGLILAVLLFFLPRGYELYQDQLETRGAIEDGEEEQRDASTDSGALRAAEADAAETSSAAGQQEQEHHHAEPERHVDIVTALKELLCNGRYLLLCFAYAAYQFNIGATSAFVVLAVAQSSLGIDQGMAAIIVGVALCFSGIAGSLLFGKLTDKYAPVASPAVVPRATFITAVAAAVSIPLFCTCLLSRAEWLFVLTLFPACFLIVGLTPAVTVALLGVVRPELRVYSISVQMLVCHLLGDAVSPVIVGRLATSFAGRCVNADQQECEAMNYQNVTYFPDGAGGLLTGECKWLPKRHKGEDSYCADTMALQKALLVAQLIGSLMVPLWLAVALRGCCKKAGGDGGDELHHPDGEKKIQHTESDPLLGGSSSWDTK